jgi:hypothetical protein
MATEKRELSDQDELIADLLGQGWTHRMIAETVGVSTKTVQRRLADPPFSSVVSKRRRGRFGQLSGLRKKICACLPCLTPAAST